MADKQAKLTVGGQELDLPILEGTTGPDVVDIRKLYGQSGMFTYDPGYTSTASCESALTYIDGDAGVLLHRGYPIGQLAEHSSFIETSPRLPARLPGPRASGRSRPSGSASGARLSGRDAAFLGELVEGGLGDLEVHGEFLDRQDLARALPPLPTFSHRGPDASSRCQLLSTAVFYSIRPGGLRSPAQAKGRS